ncbi:MULTISPECIES: glutathione peroxidase [Vitreoscilla]|uniref:Glutathione peroxidase n=1 Tax=Vitreoscilla stercoraria TaxID=61 RepID=A0ABY4E9F8_VITST|nr:MULTISPECIES: glutathione peroxidase [Vitreoscilla]AUZ04378.1 glutathione peroxidase [Vitreoscilla sp. C1]UOO91894.1 glutathione peroxidase [Vitreoscilla stercoraria]
MNIYSHFINDLSGHPISLTDYQNHAILIFNSASECGFTPQLTQLVQLHHQYAHQGLVIIGCPCNQFRQQEPGSANEIAQFCESRYHIPFLMTEKIDVNGPHTHPLWQDLKQAQTGFLGTSSIKWNFTKFLINRSGEVVERVATWRNPMSMVTAIEKVLK